MPPLLLALCVFSMSLLERYVSARIKYDSVTGKLSHYFWGSELSAHRLIIHVIVILGVVGAVGFEAKSSGDYRHFYVFSVLGVIDLIGMFWKWRKDQNT